MCCPTYINPKNLEIIFTQSMTATSLDQLVYSPNCYTHPSKSKSNAQYIFSATVTVCSSGLFWMKSVVIVLFMLCSAMFAE